MKGLNRAWHEQHPMPKNPSNDQRIAWHLEHVQVCDCRPIPGGVVKLMLDQGLSVPNRRPRSKP
jgi:hypothetical protein